MTADHRRALVPLIAAALCIGRPAYAQEAEAPETEVTLEAAALTEYVWRGQVINDEPVLQPYAEISHGGFLFSTWGNLNLTDRVTDDPDFSELDLTASYTFEFGAMALEAGVTEYTYPNTAEETEIETPDGVQAQREPLAGSREAFVEATWPDLFVVPRLTLFYDFDEADGFYAAVALEKEIDLPMDCTLTPAISAGWGSENYNEYSFGVSQDALNDAEVGLTAGCSFTDALSATATIRYMWLLDDDIKDGARATFFDDSALCGGLGLAWVF